MSHRIPSRATGELVLAWVRDRSQGRSSSVIASKYGVTPERVRTATMRVMRDDLETRDNHDLSDRGAAYCDTSTRARA